MPSSPTPHPFTLPSITHACSDFILSHITCPPPSYSYLRRFSSGTTSSPVPCSWKWWKYCANLASPARAKSTGDLSAWISSFTLLRLLLAPFPLLLPPVPWLSPTRRKVRDKAIPPLPRPSRACRVLGMLDLPPPFLSFPPLTTSPCPSCSKWTVVPISSTRTR